MKNGLRASLNHQTARLLRSRQSRSTWQAGHLGTADLRPEDLELRLAAEPQRRWPRDWVEATELLLEIENDPTERAFLRAIAGRWQLTHDQADRVTALLHKARQVGL